MIDTQFYYNQYPTPTQPIIKNYNITNNTIHLHNLKMTSNDIAINTLHPQKL